MKIINLNSVRGSNIWSKDHYQLTVFTIEIIKLQSLADKQHSEFINTIKNGLELYFTNLDWPVIEQKIKKLSHMSALAYVCGLATIELQRAAGIDCEYFAIKTTAANDLTIITESTDDETGKLAANAAVKLADCILQNKPYAFSETVKKISDKWHKKQPGQLTASILNEARKRNIPIISLDGNRVFQLGHGINQKRIMRSFTSGTSFIGVKLSSNKDLTKKILNGIGIPVPKGVLIYNKTDLQDAIESIGFPVVVKPVKGNNGRGVGVNIRTLADARTAFEKAEEIVHGQGIVVEKHIEGFDYRLLIINGKFTAAVKRTPAMITGDGKLSIQELIDKANNDPRRGDGHSKPLTFIQPDQTTLQILKNRGFTTDSILPKEENLYLKLIGNLSAGGTSTDVTEIIHPDNILTAERITKTIGLDICGLDIISPDISIPFSENNSAVVEVNSAPGLRLHLDPSEGKSRNVTAPIIDMLFPPGATPYIPVIAIIEKSANGILAGMISDLLSHGDYHVGCAVTDFVSVEGIMVSSKRLSYTERLEMIFKDPTVNIAVFDCPEAAILNNGLNFNSATIGIINDIDIKSETIKSAKLLGSGIDLNGFLIFNSDRPHLISLAQDFSCNVAITSTSPDNLMVRQHIRSGGYAVVIEKQQIVIYENQKRTPLIDIINHAGYNTGGNLILLQNILIQVLVGVILRTELDVIKKAVKKQLNIKNPVSLMLNCLSDFVNTEKIIEAANDGIDYLFNCINPNGSFVYEIHAKTGKRLNSYNILRHAGCVYILYQWLNFYNQLADKAILLEKVVHYLQSHIKKLKNKPDLYCVVEKNEIKLGGTALTILALIEKYKLNAVQDDLSLICALGNFIVWMQDSTGKFKSKLYYNENIFSDFESTYYPGEAILALIRLHHIDPKGIWLKHAQLGIDYLLKNPMLNNDGTHGHHHWLATALAEYYQIVKNDKIYDELWNIANATILAMKKNYSSGGNNYTYSSAAMATRGETIAATLALEFSLRNDSQIGKLFPALNESVDFCLSFQIKENVIFNKLNLKGGIKKAQNNGKIRIDYVQHTIQVLLVMLRLS